jgi:hypothetical protein
MASLLVVRGAKAQGTETTPAKLELIPAVGLSQTRKQTMAKKKKGPKKKAKPEATTK